MKLYNIIYLFIHKNLPDDTPNDFPKFHGDWMYCFLKPLSTDKQTHIHFYILYIDSCCFVRGRALASHTGAHRFESRGGRLLQIADYN